MAVINTVQFGTAILATGISRLDVALTAVNTSQAFLVYTQEGVASTAERVGVAGFLLGDGSSARFLRLRTGGAITISYQVPEFTSGVSVQHGSISLTATTTNVLLPTAITTDSAFMTFVIAETGAAWRDDTMFGGQIVSATSMQAIARAVQSETGYFQVIQFDTSTNQRGTLRWTTTQSIGTVSLTAVDTTKAAVLLGGHQGQSGITGRIDDKFAVGYLVNGTTLSLQRASTSGIFETLWQVIEYTDGTIVEDGVASVAATSTATSVSHRSVDTSRSVSWTGSYYRSCYTENVTNNSMGSVSFRSYFTAEDSLRVQRFNAIGAASVAWFVTQFDTAAAAVAVVDGSYATALW